jgi:rhodanese-related sulfurtransferase
VELSVAEIRTRNYADVRAALLARQEIALLDVREEDPHAQSHPLFAANFPLARIEINAYLRLPRRSVPIVVLDDGDGDAGRAAVRLSELGYSNVAVLDGGIAGWAAAGGELFRDVNVPSKAFGELVEAQRHTPSLAAEEVQALIDAGADIVIVDARRFDEYQTMSIPTARSVPGAELVLRLPTLAPDPATRVIVNCAGRTRSIIGTQSLLNAGLPNPVAALRNGTIGWTLAGQKLEHGQDRRFGEVSAASARQAAGAARQVADRAGVRRLAADATLARWQRQHGRSTYCFDVRTPEEYVAGHLPGFLSAPGGQLVQETEMLAPVRGARLVLVDDDGVRANMSASWLAQMGWEVYVLDDVAAGAFAESGSPSLPLPALPAVNWISPAELSGRLAGGDLAVLDLARHADYQRGHLAGAWFVQRGRLADALHNIPAAGHYVLTCPDGQLAAFAVAELAALVGGQVAVLAGGTLAWRAAGHAVETGPTRLASAPIDRYRRPYEGTDNPRAAMQGYLDWEYGLVEQLGRDGTHGFRVI